MKLATAPVNLEIGRFFQSVGAPYLIAADSGDGWSFAQALKSYIFAPLGEGIPRVPEVIDSLRHSGYTGWLVIEQDTTPDGLAAKRLKILSQGRKLSLWVARSGR